MEVDYWTTAAMLAERADFYQSVACMLTKIEYGKNTRMSKTLRPASVSAVSHNA